LVPLASGTALAVVMIVPPADSGFAREWTRHFDPERAAQVAASAWRALVPIPDLATPFPWNSNIADGLSWRMQGALGGLALVTALWILRRDLLPLLFFVVAVLGVCAFSYSKYPGSLRHHGHLYLALLVAMWLASSGRQSGLPGSADSLRRGLFALQAVAGIWIGAADWMKPFSANRRAAEWIAAGDFGDYLLAGSGSHPVSGVGMYLGRPVYYLKQQRWGTFIVWDNRSRPFGGSAALFQRAADIGDLNAKPVLLILNEELPEQGGFQLQVRFTDSLIRDERFFVYTRERQEANREARGERVRR
jgi:hypothetical protein